jgi:hypothetical protein
MATVGALVGWKFRAALVLGHVKAVDGDKLTITPVSKPESDVKRKREKVLLESELDPADVEEALHRHGHMARTATKSRGAKAQAVGLDTPSQARASAAMRCERAASCELRATLGAASCELRASSRRLRGLSARACGSQMMPAGEARAAKRSREGEYKKEAGARKKAAPSKARGGRAGKGASPEGEEEEDAPLTPKPPTKARGKAATEAPKRGGKKAAKAA